MASEAVLIDVMTPEDYASCHIAGAKNACIYEMVFPDRIAECAPDRNAKLVVYDASGTTLAAKTARERLLKAGYGDVSVLEGGLSAWLAAGYPVEKGEPAAEARLEDGSYLVDTGASVLEWIGRNLNNRHHGRVAIRSGELMVEGGQPVAGSIVLDMDSISNIDLADPGWHDMLIRHLKSEDFFGVAQYPTASFRLTGWEAKKGGSAEAPEGTFSGELTIKDVTRPFSSTAIVAPQADGSLKAHASFDLDRTLWNVCYGSCRMFERLGMHLVHDIVSLELFVLAKKGAR